MYRKLHNTLFASSASALILALGLLAADPSLPSTSLGDAAESSAPTLQGALDAATATPAVGTGMNNDDAIESRGLALEARISTRAAHLQRELEQSNSLSDTLASAASFAAEVSTDAAIDAMATELADQSIEKPDPETEQQRHARKVRGVVAVPYFSFAQGMRRNSRS